MGTTNILDLNNRIDELEKLYPASHVMMSDGVTSVEEAVDTLNSNLTTKGVNVTLSDKCAQGSLITSRKYGNIVVFSIHIITASACSRNDVLATFDLPSDFSTNYFSAFTNGNLNLFTHTKNLVADGSIAQGVTIIGQLIGIIS